MLGKVLGQQMEKGKENFFDTLGKAMLADNALHHTRQVVQKETVKHTQARDGIRLRQLLVMHGKLQELEDVAVIIIGKR